MWIVALLVVVSVNVVSAFFQQQFSKLHQGAIFQRLVTFSVGSTDKTDILNESNDLFSIWGKEEAKIAEQEKLEQVKELQEEFGSSGLPSYALKWLQEYEQENEHAPLPASKLPTMVIIGRPNTGKSTLVNRIANAFKVSNLGSKSNTDNNRGLLNIYLK